MRLGSKKQIVFLAVLLVILASILVNYLVPIASKTVACTPDGKERYSILLGQKSEYDSAQASNANSDQLCQLDPFKVSLHIL